MNPARHHPDLMFADRGNRKLFLDLLLPEGIARPPLVMVIHGGGWKQGDRKDEGYEWLVEHGHAMARIEYRYSHEARFPAQEEDCIAALEWLAAHQREFGYDASRIAALGTSAGGQLALLLGCGPDRRIAAVIAYCPPCDFILRAVDQPQSTERPGGQVHDLLGTPPGGNPDLARHASPAHRIHKGTAPCLVFHCAQDQTVLGNQPLSLMDACFHANVDATLVAVPHGGHCDESMRTGARRETALAFLRNHLR